MHEWLPHEPSLHYELNSGDKQTFLCAENKWNPCFFSNTQDLGKKKKCWKSKAAHLERRIARTRAEPEPSLFALCSSFSLLHVLLYHEARLLHASLALPGLTVHLLRGNGSTSATRWVIVNFGKQLSTSLLFIDIDKRMKIIYIHKSHTVKG